MNINNNKEIATAAMRLETGAMPMPTLLTDVMLLFVVDTVVVVEGCASGEESQQVACRMSLATAVAGDWRIEG